MRPHHQKRALKILAKSIYRELKRQGFDPTQIVNLAAELIARINQDLALEQQHESA